MILGTGARKEVKRYKGSLIHKGDPAEAQGLWEPETHFIYQIQKVKKEEHRRGGNDGCIFFLTYQIKELLT